MKTFAAVFIITKKVKSKSRKNLHMHPWGKFVLFMRHGAQEEGERRRGLGGGKREEARKQKEREV